MTDNQRKAHDRLSLYNEARRDIRAARQKVQIIESRCNKMTRSCDSIMQDTPSGVRVPLVIQHCNVGNSQEALLDQLMQAREYYWNMCCAAQTVCMDIERSIQQRCTGIYARVLSSLYLFNQRLEQIAVTERYSYGHIKRVKWDALEQYGKDEPQ